MKVRLAHIEQAEFKNGLRCAYCDLPLLSPRGRKISDRLIYERRVRAEPLVEGTQRWAFVWEIVCQECANG